MDLSMTPPAPPLAIVHQRCVILLKSLDEKYLTTAVEPIGSEHLFSDYFLSEVSSVIFQPGSSLTVYIFSSKKKVILNVILQILLSDSAGRNVLFGPCLYGRLSLSRFIGKGENLSL